ncbi:hypothetical protein LFYK43_12430 [Ligilactobacillus salitolerans]|uniref:LXG domain-containing protein n=1 Tax=Ligilactobacillus salitolerans TaxID=1808352 RepID=A0A401ITD9_9LACO|nr:T7SS effector LXG polymorphic toxin [Ligilactobacillus salitolerans]GBG94784.1 hypothetical protein LFYK43_12430 [Ligilactobacillus salitolerans]
MLQNYYDVLFRLYDSYDKELEKFKATVHENDETALIDTDSFGPVKNKFSTAETDFADLERQFKQAYANIEDIVSVKNPSSSRYIQELHNTKKVLTNTEKWLGEINGDKLGTGALDLLADQKKELQQLSQTKGQSFTAAGAKAIYIDPDFKMQVKDSHAVTTKLEKQAADTHKAQVEKEGFMTALINGDLSAKDIDEICTNVNGRYDYVRGIVSTFGSPVTLKSFQKYGKSGRKADDLLMKDFRDLKQVLRKHPDNKYAQAALKKMGKGSFNQFLKGKPSKMKDFVKSWQKYEKVEGWVKNRTGKVSEMAGKYLPKVKGFGKLAKVGGWTTMGVSAGIDTGTSFVDKNSKGYHSVGKSVIHAGINSVKNIGPVTGAIAGAKIGAYFPGGAAIGAGAGLVIGEGLKIWGAVSPKTKKKVFDFVEKGSDKIYDKTIGKAVKKISLPGFRRGVRFA